MRIVFSRIVSSRMILFIMHKRCKNCITAWDFNQKFKKYYEKSWTVSSWIVSSRIYENFVNNCLTIVLFRIVSSINVSSRIVTSIMITSIIILSRINSSIIVLPWIFELSCLDLFCLVVRWNKSSCAEMLEKMLV